MQIFFYWAFPACLSSITAVNTWGILAYCPALLKCFVSILTLRTFLKTCSSVTQRTIITLWAFLYALSLVVKLFRSLSTVVDTAFSFLVDISTICTALNISDETMGSLIREKIARIFICLETFGLVFVLEVFRRASGVAGTVSIEYLIGVRVRGLTTVGNALILIHKAF